MANLLNIKNKIQSTKNTGQITKALELVSASKQKKSQDFLNHSRYLRIGVRDLIGKIRSEIGSVVRSESEEVLPKYLIPRNSDRVLIVTVMSQRGLCGPINTNLYFEIAKFTESTSKQVDFVSVSKSAQRYLKNFKENIVSFFPKIKDNPDMNEIMPIIDLVKDSHDSYSEIYLAYTNFIKPGVIEPRISKLLPIDATVSDTDRINPVYKIEPNPYEILSSICELFIDLEIYEAILSSQVSEHSARVQAMKKASDNAKDMVDELTLNLNKARQAKITAQTSEISSSL